MGGRQKQSFEDQGHFDILDEVVNVFIIQILPYVAVSQLLYNHNLQRGTSNLRKKDERQSQNGKTGLDGNRTVKDKSQIEASLTSSIKYYSFLDCQPLAALLEIVKTLVVMSADSAVTYTSVHSEARSWSIPSEDPYEEAAQQLFEQAPRSPDEVRHLYLYSTIFLAHGLLPLSLLEHSRLEMRDVASAYYHSVHPSGTPQLLPIPLRAPSSSRRADVPEADAPPRKRLLLTTPRPGCEIGESSAAAAARQPGPTIETRLLDTERRMMTALELVNRRISYQAAVDLAVQHIMRPRPWRRGSVKFYGLLPASRRYRSFVLVSYPV
ncbi:hypothetical protein Tco_0410021 [Tanacetum coccineum]